MPISPTTCIYCARPALAPGYTTPPLCLAHLEAALLVSRAQRAGRAISDSEPLDIPAAFSITREQWPTLLREMLRYEAQAGSTQPGFPPSRGAARAELPPPCTYNSGGAGGVDILIF